jgi:hypothetical protein
MRVQQVRNIGVIEDNAPVSANEWEEIKKSGDNAVKKWIDNAMSYRSCVIVLIGSETANRPWVKYEIEKAWNTGKGLFGIYIHNLKDPRTGICKQGENPFDQFTVGNSDAKLSTYVKCYNPKANDAYSDIAANIESWIEAAINARQ